MVFRACSSRCRNRWVTTHYRARHSVGTHVALSRCAAIDVAFVPCADVLASWRALASSTDGSRRGSSIPRDTRRAPALRRAAAGIGASCWCAAAHARGIAQIPPRVLVRCVHPGRAHNRQPRTDDSYRSPADLSNGLGVSRLWNSHIASRCPNSAIGPPSAVDESRFTFAFVKATAPPPSGAATPTRARLPATERRRRAPRRAAALRLQEKRG